MITNGKNPDMAEAVKNNLRIRESLHVHGPFAYCGHDFWEQAHKMDFGDVVMCNRCHTYYAKIKHLPWLVEKKAWLKDDKVTGYDINHLDGPWFTPVCARVT